MIFIFYPINIEIEKLYTYTHTQRNIVAPSFCIVCSMEFLARAKSHLRKTDLVHLLISNNA